MKIRGFFLSKLFQNRNYLHNFSKKRQKVEFKTKCKNPEMVRNINNKSSLIKNNTNNKYLKRIK